MVRSADVDGSTAGGAEDDSHKPRMLCLHGYRSNETISKLQMENLGLASKFKITYLSGHLVSDEPAKGQEQLAHILSEGPFYSWFEMELEDEGAILDQILKSLKNVLVHLDMMQLKFSSKDEPLRPYYDAVYGFSQGASIVTLLSDTEVVEAIRKEYAAELKLRLPSSQFREVHADGTTTYNTGHHRLPHFNFLDGLHLGKTLADLVHVRSPMATNGSSQSKPPPRKAMDDLDLNTSLHNLKKLSAFTDNRNSSMVFDEFSKHKSIRRKAMDDWDLNTSVHNMKKLAAISDKRPTQKKSFQAESSVQDVPFKKERSRSFCKSDLALDSNGQIIEKKEPNVEKEQGIEQMRKSFLIGQHPPSKSNFKNITSGPKVIVHTLAGADVSESKWNKRKSWRFCFVACHGRVHFVEIVEQKLFGNSKEIKNDIECGDISKVSRSRNPDIGSVHYIGIQDSLKSESEKAMLTYYKNTSNFPIYIDAGHVIPTFRSKVSLRFNDYRVYLLL